MITGTTIELFKRRNYFKNRYAKAVRDMRMLAHRRVLAKPTITVAELQSSLIGVLQVRPVTAISLVKIEPAPARQPLEVGGDELWRYRNKAIFTFDGGCAPVVAQGAAKPFRRS